VAVASVIDGMVKPQAEFMATACYQETSDLAAEVSGLAVSTVFTVLVIFSLLTFCIQMEKPNS
jgi:hypothetical protein